jgi:hypothetical protein
MMTRRLAFVLACLGAALAGCATPLASYDNGSSYGAAFPMTTPPAPLPPNAFGPEEPHDFGSQGP